MLKALKVASESYLERPISAAEVVIPFRITASFHDALLSACFSVPLKLPMSTQPPAGILAARAYGIGIKTCQDTSQDDPDQIILTIDYSRSSLTALVVHEVCSIFETRRELHDTRFGLDGLHGSEANRGDLERALSELIDLPLADEGLADDMNSISHVVLLGESANDPQLHNVLKKVLGKEYSRMVADASQSRSHLINPVFAASRGVAHDCFNRLDYEENGKQVCYDPLDDDTGDWDEFLSKPTA
jgi:hypothetical protein